MERPGARVRPAREPRGRSQNTTLPGNRSRRASHGPLPGGPGLLPRPDGFRFPRRRPRRDEKAAARSRRSRGPTVSRHHGASRHPRHSRTALAGEGRTARPLSAGIDRRAPQQEGRGGGGERSDGHGKPARGRSRCQTIADRRPGRQLRRSADRYAIRSGQQPVWPARCDPLGPHVAQNGGARPAVSATAIGRSRRVQPARRRCSGQVVCARPGGCAPCHAA